MFEIESALCFYNVCLTSRNRRQIGEEKYDNEREEETVSSHWTLCVRPCCNQADCRNRALCVNTRVPRFTQSACTSVSACRPLFIETTKTNKVEVKEDGRPRRKHAADLDSIAISVGVRSIFSSFYFTF